MNERPPLSPAIGLWHWKVRSGQVMWSPEQYRLHGLSDTRAPAGMQMWLDTIHPDDRDKCLTAAHGALSAGAFRTVYRTRSESGGWRWLLGEGVVERGADGLPDRMIGTNIDLTSQRAMLEYLINKAERLGMLIGMDDPSPDATQRLTRDIFDALQLALREIS